MAAQSWRLDICPECGYALEGLPDVGTCPECGNAYDRGEVVLHGIARGSDATTTNGGWRAIFFSILASLCFVMPMTDKQARHGVAAPLAWLFVTLTLGRIVLALLVRWLNLRPGLVRVHLDEIGCSQLDNMSRNDRSPSEMLLLLFELLYPPVFLVGWACVLCVAPSHGWASRVFLGTAVLYLVLAAYAVFLIGRRRRTSDPLRGAAKTVPWRLVGDVEFLPAKPGHSRLRIRMPRKWYKLDNAPVDAEVRCTSAQVEQLRRMTQLWMSLSHTSSSTR